MLISDNIAGAIIGKSGSAINQLQEESGARIKVSQNNDFYPNSRDRTLLILGTVENVLFAQELIWQKIAQVLLLYKYIVIIF
jgi:RNA-binding protein Nova